jgi:hypothetical protein
MEGERVTVSHPERVSHLERGLSLGVYCRPLLTFTCENPYASCLATLFHNHSLTSSIDTDNESSISFYSSQTPDQHMCHPGLFLQSMLKYLMQKTLLKGANLLHTQSPRALPLRRPLLLVAIVKGHCALVVAAKVIKVLDLVNPDDPVLARKGLLDSAEFGALGG